MRPDLKNMSRNELIKLKAQIGAALEKIREKERSEAKKAAAKVAAKFGFTLEELTQTQKTKGAVPKKKAKAPAPPKYRSADGTSTWSGQGRPPRWFKQAVDSGVDPTTMEVSNHL